MSSINVHSAELYTSWRSHAPVYLKWLPVIVGLAVLFLPTYYDLSQTLWNTEENGHGPIILFVVVWQTWSYRAALLLAPSKTKPITGSLLLIFGLLLYVAGRSQQLMVFEIGAEIPILTGILLITLGTPTVRKLWFPLFFLIFLIPIPGAIVDMLTGPLKYYVSVIAEQVLYSAGYPIARNGVVLSIGYYQLLVADACSGLNSMFSLSALGILYMHVMQRTSVMRNALLLATILPVAFTSNVIRVLFLMLITYYYGDEVGQSYLHQFAGIVMFTASILNHFMLDNLLGIPFPDRIRETR
ncbi:MAG: exosortase B [Sulfuriferula sp.]